VPGSRREGIATCCEVGINQSSAASIRIDEPQNSMRSRFVLITSALLILACFMTLNRVSFAQMNDTKSSPKLESAVFGGGCFWCLDAQFKLVNGVKSVLSGYAGGATKNPTYEQVCSETTGHAEVIEVEFDPAVVSYEDLLRKFFHAHDPTTLDRQGPDVGTSYRSIILYKDENQKAIAEKVKAEAQKQWPDPIVTEIAPLTTFYKAEDYHQDYFAKNPDQGYCRVVVAPKVRKFEKMLQEQKQ
jgi:peptide-methionine (S)-S-oxide reductase